MGIAPTREQYLNYRNVDHDAVADFGSGAFELLLMRMEALQLEPDEVRRIESSVFSGLAEACATCESNNRCESDLAYESAGTVTRDWENYCPNAATLNAMKALPWFGNRARGLPTGQCLAGPARPRARAHGLGGSYPAEMRRSAVATLIERAASVVRNGLHRSWHAREQGGEPYGLSDDGVRMVMSDLGMSAYDIWRTGAHQRAIEGHSTEVP